MLGLLSSGFCCGRCRLSRQGLFFGLSNGVQLSVYPFQTSFRVCVTRNEIEGFLEFVFGVFPTFTGLGTGRIFHGVVVPHPCALEVVRQIRQSIQLVVDSTAHVVGVVQIELDAAAAFVKRSNANGSFGDAFVKPFNRVKQRHVKVKHETIRQFIFRGLGAVDGHPLGNHPLGLKHDDVVVSQRQIEEVLAIAIHLNFVERLSVLQNRDGDVVEPLFGLLMLQIATHHERLGLAPSLNGAHPTNKGHKEALPNEAQG